MMSRLIVVGVVIASAACGKTVGTETGNPPVIAGALIHVEAVDDDHVRVSGEAGAIEPGGGEVSVTNTTRDDEPVEAEVAVDGSFSVELTGTPDDDYEVVATGADGDAPARTVVGGGGGGDRDGGTMTGDWQTLHECVETEPSDPLTVTALAIEGDTLHVDVSHGGGCEQHRYGLCYERLWQASSPVQLGLRVLHDDGGDACMAILTESLSFELTAIKDAYADQFGEGPGAVNLGFDACMLDDGPVAMCQVLYEWGEPGKPCGPPIGPACPLLQLPEAPAAWVLYDAACQFSFRGPDDLEHVDVTGIDSCVDQFANDRCTFELGSGGFSSGLADLEESGSEVEVGRTTIDGLDAKVVTAFLPGEPLPYFAGVHFPDPPFETEPSFGVSADLVIHCTTAEDRDAMLPALGTVQFE